MKDNKKIGDKIKVDDLEYIDYYTLVNPKNYKSTISNNVNEIVTKYICLVTEYMLFVSEKINMNHHEHFKFIIERGVDTISHVFLLIYYYTKNLELTFYHCQKAYCFYSEFIEQISDDQITFLQLSSKEAVLFVYKKTIYDLHNEYKKNVPDLLSEEKIIMKTIDSYIKINKMITNYVIYNNSFKKNNKIEYIKLYSNQISESFSQLSGCKFKLKIIECVYILTKTISNNIIISNDDDIIYSSILFNILNDFTKQLESKKQKLNIDKIKKKLELNDINVFLNNRDTNIVININNFIFN